jgi:hypothetical protein
LGGEDKNVFRKEVREGVNESLFIGGEITSCCTCLLGMMIVDFGCGTTMYFSHFLTMF